MFNEQMVGCAQLEGSITGITDPSMFYHPPHSNSRVDTGVWQYQSNQAPLLVPRFTQNSKLIGPGVAGRSFNPAAVLDYSRDANGSTSARVTTTSNLGYGSFIWEISFYRFLIDTGAHHPSQSLVPRPISVSIPIAQVSYKVESMILIFIL